MGGFASSEFSPTLEQAVHGIPRGTEARGLREAVGVGWPTPTVQDASNDGGPSQYERNSLPLNAAVKTGSATRPTPKATVRGDCPSERERNTPDIEAAVRMDAEGVGCAWRTPQNRDYRTGMANRLGRTVGDSDEVAPLSLSDQAVATDGKRLGQLNPAWVEGLMGLPHGWTDPDYDGALVWHGWPAGPGQRQYPYEPPRLAVGVKQRVARLKALGNAVVPQQAMCVFAAIMEAESQEREEGGPNA